MASVLLSALATGISVKPFLILDARVGRPWIGCAKSHLAAQLRRHATVFPPVEVINAAARPPTCAADGTARDPCYTTVERDDEDDVSVEIVDDRAIRNTGKLSF